MAFSSETKNSKIKLERHSVPSIRDSESLIKQMLNQVQHDV